MDREKIRILHENFRQGYGIEGTILHYDDGYYTIQYQDEGEDYICMLKRDDIEFIDR